MSHRRRTNARDKVIENDEMGLLQPLVYEFNALTVNVAKPSLHSTPTPTHMEYCGREL